jgi:hypothetical protein
MIEPGPIPLRGLRANASARYLFCLAVIAASLGGSQHAIAAPSITKLNLRGLQAGSTTNLVIDGTDLLPAPRLVTSLPIASQTVKEGATATRIQLDITLDADVEPGFYNAWLVTDKGVSQRQIIAVDFLRQQPLRAKAGELPVALHGNFTNSLPVETTFYGKAGLSVTIEVESIRLGSKEQPVIHLLDSLDREIALGLPTILLRGDSRITAILPADGEYKIRLHDLQYAGAGAFRLRIGSWNYADAVFPPAIQRGKATKLTLIGAPFGDGQVDCTPGNLAIMPAPWVERSKSSGLRPAIMVSDIQELLGTSDEKSPQVLSDVKPPFAISGRLTKPGAQDRYAIEVVPESTLQFSVVAAQMGSPVDAVLEVRDTKGVLLASNDGSPNSSDPRLDFVVPKNVKSLVIGIHDAFARGGEASIYRLIVSPGPSGPGASSQSADFDLAVEDDTISPSVAASHVLKVTTRRHGYDGAIALRLVGADACVELQKDAQIPAGADAALVTIKAKADSAEPTPAVIGRLTGEVKRDDTSIVRFANFDRHPLGDVQPWLGSELLIAPIAKPDVVFEPDFASNQESVEGMLGRKIILPVKCARPTGFDGAVRLTLFTSQIVPLTRNTTTPDPARTLRPEATKVEIPADAKATAAETARLAAEKTLTDAQKAVKAAKTVTPALEAKVTTATQALEQAQAAAAKAFAGAKNSASVTLLIPPDLAVGSYDLAFKAELLSRDGTKVLATQFTPVQKLNVLSPITIALEGEPRVEVKLDSKTGAIAKWSGHISRAKEVSGVVTLGLEGLPKGVIDPIVVIPAGKTDFKLDLKIPPTTVAGETAGIKLFATFKVDAAAKLNSRSPNVELALKVEAGKPPEKVAN